MTVQEAGVFVALLAMLALHFFRGPNRQNDDLRAELQQEVTRLRAEVSDLRREHDALEKEVTAIEKRLVGEHYSVKEMLIEMRGQVTQLSSIVGDLKAAVASIRSGG